MLDKQIKDKKP